MVMILMFILSLADKYPIPSSLRHWVMITEQYAPSLQYFYIKNYYKKKNLVEWVYRPLSILQNKKYILYLGCRQLHTFNPHK